MSPVIVFILGLGALIIGGEALVRAASRLAAATGISPLVIGLTIVAFGTSSPELAVVLQSSARGEMDLLMGNVIGSNIFNVLAILGLSAVVSPLLVSRQLIRLDVPVMIAVSLALFLLALNGTIGRLEGLVMLGCGVAYTLWLLRLSRQENRREKANRKEDHEPPESLRRMTLLQVGWHIFLLVAGVFLLNSGADWLVQSAVKFAAWLGVSAGIIGLTIVAAGTSLPELVTSIVAASRGERDIAVGNVVGSNIFNILFVLGLGSALASGGTTVSLALLQFDIPVMVAVAVACLPIFFSGHLIDRWEGALFVGWLGLYLFFLVQQSDRHDSSLLFYESLFYFVVPLLLLTLGIFLVRSTGITGDQEERGEQ